MKFSELSIDPEIISACQRAGFENLTEIQEKCLGPALEGKDIAGISQTGTGKTVAFLLPVLDKILKEKLPGPAALILTPTRELCLQISEEATKLTSNSPISVCTIYGGEGYKRQEDELASNPQLIVATPGRLIDYIKQGKLDLNNLHFLVLDEADRMLDMGFIRDIRFIMKRVPREAQTMLFSATLSYYVMRLASDFMHEPVEVRIESETVAVEKINQQLLHLGKEEKLPYLVNQVVAVPEIRGIVFTNLRVYVQTIVNTLRRFGIHAVGLSSMLDQKKRVKLLRDFKMGKYSVLVATDVASRGLDVDDISHVFNFDLPQDAESYVHRIGRTARAGKSGISISYCSEMDYESLPRIESYLGSRIPVASVDTALVSYPVGEFKSFHDDAGPDQNRDAGRQRDGSARSGGGRGRGNFDRGGDRNRDRNRDRDRNSDRNRNRQDSYRGGKNSDSSQSVESSGPRDRDSKEPRGKNDSRPSDSRREHSHSGGSRGPGGHNGNRKRRSGRHNNPNRNHSGRSSTPRRETAAPAKKGIISRILSIFKKK